MNGLTTLTAVAAMLRTRANGPHHKRNGVMTHNQFIPRCLKVIGMSLFSRGEIPGKWRVPLLRLARERGVTLSEDELSDEET